MLMERKTQPKWEYSFILLRKIPLFSVVSYILIIPLTVANFKQLLTPDLMQLVWYFLECFGICLSVFVGLVTSVLNHMVQLECFSRKPSSHCLLCWLNLSFLNHITNDNCHLPSLSESIWRFNSENSNFHHLNDVFIKLKWIYEWKEVKTICNNKSFAPSV